MAMDTVLNLWLMGMMTLALVLFSGSFVGAIYFSWKIFNNKEPNVYDLFLLGFFAALGFLSKYLFL